MGYSHVLKDSQSNILGFFLIHITDSNGVFSLTIISSIVVMIPKSLSYRAG